MKILNFLFPEWLTLSLGGGGSDSQTTTTRTEIPDELKPLVKQSSAITGRALSDLESRLMGNRARLNLPQGARIENGRVVRDISTPSTGGGLSNLFGPRPQSGDNLSQFMARQVQGGENTGGTQTIDLGAVSDFRTQGSGADNLVADFDPAEREAMQLAEARARGEGDFIPTFQDQLLSTARGDFLFGGQGFDEALEAANRRVQPSILSRFGSSGRLDSGLAQNAIAQSISDSFAGLFNQERGRQMQALNALPTAATIDTDLLSQIGETRRGMAQREIDAPIDALQRLIAASQGVAPTTSQFGQSQTQPLHRNRGAGAIGGGLTGAATGAKIGSIVPGLGTGVGAAVGGGLGLLGGMFS